ncbi:hypothetical protein SCP_0401850 [Sparassis crispa]|uniref:Uncharacterized protein n=1 Tax=Sparassis crispa TaxID=139825 RepID=A0A401GI14_9APHY|nr:hypothetical protein SCP_0401850 [Sparassis crispa]GBE81812.1 hypothetical protein SCP_0401850 [Sparassis crispa]
MWDFIVADSSSNPLYPPHDGHPAYGVGVPDVGQTQPDTPSPSSTSPIAHPSPQHANQLIVTSSTTRSVAFMNHHHLS